MQNKLHFIEYILIINIKVRLKNINFTIDVVNFYFSTLTNYSFLNYIRSYKVKIINDKHNIFSAL